MSVVYDFYHIHREVVYRTVPFVSFQRIIRTYCLAIAILAIVEGVRPILLILNGHVTMLPRI